MDKSPSDFRQAVGNATAVRLAAEDRGRPRPKGRTVLPVLIATAVACLAVSAGWAVYELRAHDILPALEGPYIRARAFSFAIDALAAAWLAAVVMYAGRAAKTAQGDRPSSGRLARMSVVVACGYAALSILVQPRVMREYETIRRKSSEAALHARAAGKAIAGGDWAGALAPLEAYLAIDPTNAKWRLGLDDARARVRALPDTTPQAAATASARRAEPGVSELLASARGYMAREDYATAFALALRAEGIDAGNRDAVELRRRAAEALSRLGPDAAGKATIALYDVKQRGAAALKRGDPVAAYYILKDGDEAHPGDAELLDLLAAAEAGLAPFAFFRDTVPDPQQVPRRDRVERVAFINRREPGLVEIVYAGSVVRVPRTITETLSRSDGSQYSSRREIVEVTLHDIEVIAFGAGRVVHHMSAPVGRLMAAQEGRAPPKPALDRLTPPVSTNVALARVAFLELHRSAEADRRVPVFAAGTERGFATFGIAAAARPTAAGVAGATALPLTVPPETLWTAGLEAGGVRERDVVELWTLLRARPAIDVRVELVLRAVRPVILLILSAIAAALAAGSAPAARPTNASYALAPAVAAAGHLAFVLALHGTRVATVSLAVALGWTVGLIALAASLAGLLVLALIAMDRTLRRQR